MPHAPCRLNDNQRRMVEEHDWWIDQELRSFGVSGEFRSELTQIARLKLCECALGFEPERYPHASPSDLATIFAGYSRLAVRRAVSREMRRSKQRWGVWKPIPSGRTDEYGTPEVIDHRGTGREGALSLWCSDSARRDRRAVDVRGRMILYLHAVEGWDLAAIGGAVGISKERVRQLLDRVRATIRDTQARDAIRRQLAAA